MRCRPTEPALENAFSAEKIAYLNSLGLTSLLDKTCAVCGNFSVEPTHSQFTIHRSLLTICCSSAAVYIINQEYTTTFHQESTIP